MCAVDDCRRADRDLGHVSICAEFCQMSVKGKIGYSLNCLHDVCHVYDCGWCMPLQNVL